MAKRPLGITILGGLAVLVGFLIFAFGLLNVLTLLREGGALLLSALISVVLGFFLLLRGRGLLRLRPWSWWLVVLSLVVGLLVIFLALLGGVGGPAGAPLVFAFLVLLFLLLYFLSVRSYFRAESI